MLIQFSNQISLNSQVALIILVVAVVVTAEPGQLSGLANIPQTFLGIFGGGANNNNGGGREQGGNGRQPIQNNGQNGGQGEAGVQQQGEGGQGQGEQGQQEPLNCRSAAAKCNSNILCGRALIKRTAACTFSLLPKSCFKCQAANSVIAATPEGQEYLRCECGTLDLACRSRHRMMANCVGGQ